MKLYSILTEGMRSQVENLIEKAGKELYDHHLAFTTEPGSFRMWTRGDHSQYKDWDRIVPKEPAMNAEGSSLSDSPEKQSKAKTKAIDRLWEYLQSIPRAKQIQVKGEFGSSPYSSALKIGDVVFAKDEFTIEFGSRKRLQNTDVWKTA